jgi:flagellin-like protein
MSSDSLSDRRVSRTLRRKLQSNRAVSEVIGALLLILVVVIAVASFSLFLSTTQANAQNRQNYLNSVANEKLQVVNLELYPSNASILYELFPTTAGHSYYVEMGRDSTDIYLIDNTTLVVYPTHLTNGAYNWFGVNNSVFVATPPSPGNLKFVNPTETPSNNFTVSTAIWGNVSLIVRNFNTQPSALSSISFNGIFARNFTSGGFSYGPGNYLTIPAKAIANVTVDLTPLKITKTSPLTILLLSRAGNVFSPVYGSPAPVVKATIVSESYQVLSRDIVTLDGSQSAANANATIQNYIWKTDVPETGTGWSGSWSDVAHLATNYTSGPTIQYRPESFFTQASINSLGLQITGPIRVTLIVVDSNGMMSISQPTVIPQDPNIAPAGSILPPTISGSCPTEMVTVTIDDIFGRPLANAPVLFLRVSGSFTPTPGFGVTNSAGQVTSTMSGCTATQVLEVQSGNLVPQYVTL